MSDKASSQHVSNPAKENEEENNTNPSAVVGSCTAISSDHRAVNRRLTTFINSQDKNVLY